MASPSLLEVSFWFPTLWLFFMYGPRPFPSREQYLHMLEEYKKDLKEELKEIEGEIEEVKRGS